MILSNPAKSTKPERQKCCFIGLPASGKTHYSKQWSKMTGMERISLDEQIEQEMGASITNIVSSRGIVFFRNRESELLKQSLRHSAFVLDPGAGIVEWAVNRRMIRDNFIVIYLDMPLNVFKQRLMKKTELEKRPLLRTASDKEMEMFFRKRLPFYRSVADITLHVDYADEQVMNLITWWKSVNC